MNFQATTLLTHTAYLDYVVELAIPPPREDPDPDIF